LPRWVPMLSEFLVFALAVCLGSVLAVRGAVALFGIDPTITPVPARTALITGYAMQAAWLGVAVTFRVMGLLRLDRGATAQVPAAIAGMAGFLLAVPAVALVHQLWQMLLKALEVEAPTQTAIEFVRQANTLGELAPWIILVGVVVPVAEEYLFRHVLYRFLAGRLPEAAAIVLSSAMFGLMHGNALSVFPLTVLGVALCLAYRYTGRLVTPIMMHALFNLNSLVMVKLGA
jgi:membrane protease YdiL (CAAX protease family)